MERDRASWARADVVGSAHAITITEPVALARARKKRWLSAWTPLLALRALACVTLFTATPSIAATTTPCRR